MAAKDNGESREKQGKDKDMSSIAFHSPQRIVRVHGPECAHAHIICFDMLLMALGFYHEHDTPSGRTHLRSLFSQMYMEEARTNWLRTTQNFLRDFELYVRVEDRAAFILPDGIGSIACWYAALNTAIKLGPDPIRLLARIDAQCEMHCYVEGQHRAWLADIVEQGLAMNILRRVFDGSTYKDNDEEWWGWQRLVQMLRENDQEPVVMSHSSSMGFPDPWMMEDRMSDDDWYKLNNKEQWDISMVALRAMNERQHLEVKPETFADCYFGENISGFDIRAMLDGETAEWRRQQR